jgi:hypothetical protein
MSGYAGPPPTPTALAADSAFSSTYADIPIVGTNPKLYGAKGDGKDVTNAVITSGSGVVTSASALFTSADVGKLAYFYGAGAAGALLVTTIASYQSATQVTLTATASTSVASNGTFTWGTDDTAALASAINAAVASGGTGALTVPAGLYLCTGVLPSLTNTRDFRIQGVGGSGMDYGTYVTAPRPRTEVRYMASGSATFLDAKPSKGLLVQDIALTYGHPAWTGYVTSLSTTWNARFKRVILGGSNKTVNQGVLVDAEQMVEGVWEDVLFERCARAFRFNGYFNACVLTRCVFLACRKINLNGQDGWGKGTTFNQCVFEPQDDTGGGDPVGAPANLNLQNCKGVTMNGCAWWDATATGVWITITSVDGLTINGGYWGPNTATNNEFLLMASSGNANVTIDGIACDGSTGTNKVFTYTGTPAIAGLRLGALWLNNVQLGLDIFTAGWITWADIPSNGRMSVSNVATSSTAQTVDATAALQKITLTANCTITLPTLTTIAQPLVAKRLRLLLTQDGTGSRTVTWTGGTIRWTGGTSTPPTLSTTAGYTDEIILEWDGAGWWGSKGSTWLP